MKLNLLVATLFASRLVVPDLYSQSSDALLNKLVDKGILTAAEAKQLTAGSDRSISRAYVAKTGMPEWVTAFKFNGDFRGRFNLDDSANEADVSRVRWRYRARFGFVGAFLDDLELGLRVASSDIDGNGGNGSSPLSSYQTLQNNGSKKGIALDQAYLKWSPLHTADWKGGGTFGKMANPFVFSDVACGMDPDYTPEGAAIQLERKLGANHALRWINGAFILDEFAASGTDPFMVGSQLRFDSRWTEHVSSSLGVMWLGFVHASQLANGSVPDANVGNWRTIPNGTNQTDAVPRFDFNPVMVDASVAYLFGRAPFHHGKFPARLVVSYLNNPEAPGAADNYAWSAGFVLGKTGSRQTWEVAYEYKWLGANSIFEEVVDDDFGAYWATTAGQNFGRKDAAGFFTGTNVRGHILKLAYSPNDTVTLGLRWYHCRLIDEPVVTLGSAESLHDRLMVDVDLKFESHNPLMCSLLMYDYQQFICRFFHCVGKYFVYTAPLYEIRPLVWNLTGPTRLSSCLRR